MIIRGEHKDPRTKSKKKKKSLAKLKKELWAVFTEYIKRRDRFICFTCGRSCSGKNAHGGHFIKKSIGGIVLYFDERNVNCQCYYCNIRLDGNQYEYGVRLGKEITDELFSLKISAKNVQWDRETFDAKILYYTEKLSTV